MKIRIAVATIALRVLFPAQIVNTCWLHLESWLESLKSEHFTWVATVILLCAASLVFFARKSLISKGSSAFCVGVFCLGSACFAPLEVSPALVALGLAFEITGYMKICAERSELLLGDLSTN